MVTANKNLSFRNQILMPGDRLMIDGATKIVARLDQHEPTPSDFETGVTVHFTDGTQRGWGGFDPFLAYTGDLLWYLPSGLVKVAGWVATVVEVALAVGLLLGLRLRAVALASGVLLTVFAITMTAAFGPEPTFSYSVWSAAAGAFLLASLRPGSEVRG